MLDVVSSFEDLQVWKLIVFNVIGQQSHDDIVNTFQFHL